MSRKLRRVSIFASAAALLLMGYVFSPELNRVNRAHAVVRADDGGACTLADAAGRWGYSYSGTIVGSDPLRRSGALSRTWRETSTVHRPGVLSATSLKKRFKGVIIVHRGLHHNGHNQRLPEWCVPAHRRAGWRFGRSQQGTPRDLQDRRNGHHH